MANEEKIDWKGGFLEKVLRWQKENKAKQVDAARHFGLQPKQLYAAIHSAKKGGYMPKLRKTRVLSTPKVMDLEIPDAPKKTPTVAILVVPTNQITKVLEDLWQ